MQWETCGYKFTGTSNYETNCFCGIGTHVCCEAAFICPLFQLVVRNLGGKCWKGGGVDCYKGRDGTTQSIHLPVEEAVEENFYLQLSSPFFILNIFHILMYFIIIAGGEPQTTVEEDFLSVEEDSTLSVA